jgi:hypothetical protein
MVARALHGVELIEINIEQGGKEYLATVRKSRTVQRQRKTCRTAVIRVYL